MKDEMTMKRALIFHLSFFISAVPVFAQSVVRSERGSVSVLLPLTGTVVPAEKKTIVAGHDGRIEALPVPSQSPFKNHDLLAVIAGPDLAAIIDANATTAQQVVEARWQKMFKPQKVRAPFDGFLLETRVGMKEMVKADQPIFVVTPRLSFEAVVPLKGTPGMSPGMKAVLWRPANPELKMPGKVSEVLPGTPSAEKATVRVQLLPAEDIATPLPGTVLDGQITVAERKNVVTVPAAAVKRVEGRSFVSIEVNEGLSDGEHTEITSGLEPGKAILAP